MNIDFKVGTQLKAIRVAKGISQPALCKGICSITSLCRIESNAQAPSFELLLALVRRLGISMETLIDVVNYENNMSYYELRQSMTAAVGCWHWGKLKSLVQLVPDDVYDDLPIAEQQFVDIMRIEVVKFVDKDFSYAKTLTNKSLIKTFNAKTDAFYTSHEMTLLYMMLQFDRSPEHVDRVLQALLWIERQPEMLKDYYSWMALTTGMMNYHYEAQNWYPSLQYAMKGYAVAITKNVFRFIPNFLFIRGICLYLTKIDVDGGLYDMKMALHLCLQFNMNEAHRILLNNVYEHQIVLRNN